MSTEYLGAPVYGIDKNTGNQAWLDSRLDAAVSLQDIHFIDDYKTDKFEMISRTAESLSDLGFYGNASEPDAISRDRRAPFDKDNPATKRLIDIVDGVENWLELVPTAAALMPIYNPDVAQLPNGQMMTSDLREWLGNLYDGIGIRGRGAAVTRLAAEESMRHSEPIDMISLACGAAQPIFDALGSVRSNGASVPRVKMVDLSKPILELVDEVAAQSGLGDHVETVRMNILKRDRFDESVLGYGQSGFVEAVGIFEYLKDLGDQNEYDKVMERGSNMADAVTFLRNSYDLVKPGGMLLIGNMLDTHPQLGFTLNVVQWPHIQPRSVDQMIDIVGKSQIPVGSLDIYLPNDGDPGNAVYALYAIRKPDIGV
ncbi:hypothetical protein B7Y94_04795 [Candidatus Saccharibacteria bacterium 32-49-12]|nr:MAG: hypothetical protein B7Y94_04795 [Candidatus Saccharibacteria bacterium 32-49-12]